MYGSLAFWVTLIGLAAALVCIHYGSLVVGVVLMLGSLVVGAVIEAIAEKLDRRRAGEKK